MGTDNCLHGGARWRTKMYNIVQSFYGQMNA